MDRRADPARLLVVVSDILEAGGCVRDVADEVADDLVDAELAGHSSHGIRQLDLYLGRLKSGAVDGRARPSVASESGGIVRISGNRAFGQISAAYGARVGAERALANGVCAVAIDGCGHLGRNGHWAEIAAKRGVASLHFGQGIGSAGPVAPYGGREGRLNTNPMAFGFPGDGQGDVIFDCSTAEVAGSRIKQALERGERLDDACLVTADGLRSDDPADFVKRGAAVVTFGGFKGYAISVFSELFSAVLATGGNPKPETNSLFSIYVSVQEFLAIGDFRDRLAGFRDRIESTPPAQGHERVVLPGERSRQARADRESNGVPVDAILYRQLADAASQVGILERFRGSFPAVLIQ